MLLYVFVLVLVVVCGRLLCVFIAVVNEKSTWLVLVVELVVLFFECLLHSD